MRQKRLLKWLIGMALVITLMLMIRVWSAGAAGANQPLQGTLVFLPVVNKFRSPTPTNTPVPSATPDCPSHYGQYELDLYDMINAERENAGLAPLTVHYSLEFSAAEHSDDMAVNNFMDHTGSDGSTACERVVAAGYPSNWCAEIIMMANSPQAAMDWWMNDPLHRDMILGPFNDFGAGYAWCPGHTGRFTVDFGHR